MAKGRFEAGNKASAGVAKPNAGRPKEWLRQKCQEIIDKHRLLEFLANVANGESVEQAVGNEGEVISVPASVRDRIKATELLLERGFGKAEQDIDMRLNDVSNIPNKAELDAAIRDTKEALETVGALLKAAGVVGNE